MEVVCEVMRLKSDCVEEYLAMHRETWPDLIAAIRESGFLEEYIYRMGDVIIVIMKCESFKGSVERLLTTEVYQRWTRKVRAMLVSDRQLFGTDDVLVDLLPIWNLGDFG